LVRGVGFLVFLLSILGALRGPERGRGLYRLGLAWIALSIFPAIFAHGISPWYLYTPTVGLALLVAGLFASVESATARIRRLALAVLVTLATVPAFLVSPMAVPYPEWREISDHIRVWRGVAASLPEEFFEGPQLVAGLPFRVDYPSRHGVRVRAASGLTDFSLRAWAQLITGLDCDPRNAALVEIMYPAQHYSIQVSWIPRLQAVRLQAQGPVELSLYGEEHLFEIVERRPSELVLGGLLAPLWRWNGRYLAPVPLPIDVDDPSGEATRVPFDEAPRGGDDAP
jgi:hypothetical protein